MSQKPWHLLRAHAAVLTLLVFGCSESQQVTDAGLDSGTDSGAEGDAEEIIESGPSWLLELRVNHLPSEPRLRTGFDIWHGAEVSDGTYVFVGDGSEEIPVEGGLHLSHGAAIGLSSDGEILWRRAIADECFRDVVATGDGGALVNTMDALVRFDAQGEVAGRYVVSGEIETFVESQNEGSFVFARGVLDLPERWIELIEFSNSGDVTFAQNISGTQRLYIEDLATGDGGYYLLLNDTERLDIVHLDVGGRLDWQRSIELNAPLFYGWIVSLEQGGVVLGTELCFGDESSGYRKQIWLARLDAEGALLWQRVISARSHTSLRGLDQTSTGAVALVATTGEPEPGSDCGSAQYLDYWMLVLSLDLDGELLSSEAADQYAFMDVIFALQGGQILIAGNGGGNGSVVVSRLRPGMTGDACGIFQPMPVEVDEANNSIAQGDLIVTDMTGEPVVDDRGYGGSGDIIVEASTEDVCRW